MAEPQFRARRYIDPTRQEYISLGQSITSAFFSAGPCEVHCPFRIALLLRCRMGCQGLELGRFSQEGLSCFLTEACTKKRVEASFEGILVSLSQYDLIFVSLFRQVLGVTDPKDAEAGSLRRTVMEKWRDLGLEAEPNVRCSQLPG